MTNTKTFFRFAACIICTCVMVLAAPAPAPAKIATVAAVHHYVKTVWDIEIPYNPTHATNIPNMKYLMQVVDAANKKLNGFILSDYANDNKYASSKIAGATAVKQAVDTLIQKIDPRFFFTPATTSQSYGFKISAAGNYTIDWGDGTTDTIEKTDTTAKVYSHTYSDSANKYEITLTGKATEYSTDSTTPAIAFAVPSPNAKSEMAIKSMRGCLGCIFSTIDDENLPLSQRQPRFYWTFSNSPNLTSEIPPNLFKGIHGAPVINMYNCVFCNDTNLSGSIPAGLFGLIRGAPAQGMYRATFYKCPNLTGTIPNNLFGIIEGRGVAEMFVDLFHSDTGLTGPSAKIGDKYLYEIWGSGGDTYKGAINLSDYECIPASWGGAGTKPVGTCESTAQD